MHCRAAARLLSPARRTVKSFPCLSRGAPALGRGDTGDALKKATVFRHLLREHVHNLSPHRFHHLRDDSVAELFVSLSIGHDNVILVTFIEPHQACTLSRGKPA